MRIRKVELVVSLILLSLVLRPAAWAAQTERTILLALDQSGSMVHSDPVKLRIEAAGLLAATLNPNDQVGVLTFGDSAHWLEMPVERSRFNFSLLDQVGSSDAHTAFAPVFQSVESFLASQPPSYFQNRDISLVLLTDGRSDPVGGWADADRSQSLSIAHDYASRLHVYTVGLGNQFDRGFLDSLASPSRGLSIQAASASDLPNAFLRVAARLAALPVYQRSSTPQTLTWTSTPDRVLVVFTGQRAVSFHLDTGHPLYNSSHVAVAEENPAMGAARLAWSGDGDAFLCVQEPLKFVPQDEFPSALPTGLARPVTLRLQSAHGPLQNAYFLESATAYLNLGDGQTLPLRRQNGSSFTGQLETSSAGTYQPLAYLESPYGKVETSLGRLTAFEVPVAIASQISAAVFDPLPRAWFPAKIDLKSLLPGEAIQFQLASGSQSVELSPGEHHLLRVIPEGATGSPRILDYSATWMSNGAPISREGSLQLVVRRMSPLELLELKWPWILGILLLITVPTFLFWTLWPRPLEADLIVRQNGAQVLRLQLPSQMRTRTLHVSESAAGKPSSSCTAVIPGNQSRELLSLESVRRRGRWTIVARPAAARMAAQQGRGWSEIDLRAIRVPMFATDDGTIQINVLYS